MIYKGERWMAFECYGPKFGGSVAVCISPLDLKRGIDTSRLYVAIDGISHEKNDEAYASASAPKLLSVDGRAFLYWTSVRIRKKDSAWLGLTVKGIELVSDPVSSLILPKNYGPRMPSNHPLAFEVMGPEPTGRQADAYEVRKIGSEFYLLGASSNCLLPVAPTPGCYQLTIRRSSEPIGRHIFNGVRVSSNALPPNAVQYMHLIETPTGQMRMIGQVLPLKNNIRAEPEGYFSYSVDILSPNAYLSAAEVSKQLVTFVERAYRVFLDREVDPAGLRSHTASLYSGADKHTVLAGLLLSPEGREKFRWKELSNEDLVRFLYQRILGRAADLDGLRLWIDEIKTGRLTRDAAIKRFLSSEEFSIVRTELF